ncbi:hypothetical protein SAMN05444365_1011083 [Micromonospora pattaloongensis]|uniref:Lipoprotein n=1 Tax=Micromonospora pattaloongensis TaxID=405436 RepID=A0A1H3I2D6_9ACTN|nr:hypothetical protein [Micromonospora pattaloongensis]SDY21605.1 hypothetical protein SAMN05444365_1011083 [Micromonospora pattaloongensis]
MRLAPVLATAAVLALSTGGCTASGEPSKGESRPAGASKGGSRPAGTPVADSGCRHVDVAAAEAGPRSREWVFTAVRKVEPEWGEVTRPAELDKAFVAGVEWESPRVDKDAAVAAIENSLEYAASGTGGTLAELDRFLSGVKESRTYVGYSAVEKVSVPLTGECEDGSRVKGTLSTWADAETGVVVCATTYGKGEAPAVALRAQAEFCD